MAVKKKAAKKKVAKKKIEFGAKKKKPVKGEDHGPHKR